jgi:transcriptional regulator with XRE-family HTH domain
MRPTFGNQLERAMKAAGFEKQAALVTATGISQSTISRLITGEYTPKLEQLDTLAKACGVNRYALVGGTTIAGDYPSDCFVRLNPDASTEDSTKWLAYFASALTGPTESEREVIFGEAQVVREACEEIRAFLYEPRFFTDPFFNKAVSPHQVYRTDHSQVSMSDFVVLHTRHPSFGAGQELEIAKNSGIPVVLLQPRGATVSRMVLGSSVRMHQVYFSDSGDLRRELRGKLEALVADLMYRHNGVPAARSVDPPETLAGRLRSARVAMKIDEETLSRLVGVQRHAIENFETAEDANPSLAILARLAQVLRTTVAHLTEGVPARIEDQDPVLRESFANFLDFAQAKNVGYDDMRKLWDVEDTTYRKHRHKVAEARSAAVSVDGWEERYRNLRSGHAKPRQGRLVVDD